VNSIPSKKVNILYKMWRWFPGILVISTITAVFILMATQKFGLAPFLILIITIFTWPINNLIFGHFISDDFPAELPFFNSGWRQIPYIKGVFLIKYFAFNSGLGIELFPTVKFFIKIEDITELIKVKGFFGGNRIKYQHPGAISPYLPYLPDDVFEVLKKLMRVKL
jgi:hypothetical protein